MRILLLEPKYGGGAGQHLGGGGCAPGPPGPIVESPLGIVLYRISSVES